MMPVAALIASLPCLALGYCAIRLVELYGWVLFVGIPIICGSLSTYIYCYYEDRPKSKCVGVASLSILFLGVEILCCALDGLICVLMAFPIAFVLACLGMLLGRYFARAVRSRRLKNTAHILVLIATPLLMGFESHLHSKNEIFCVTSTIDVNAPSEAVWKYIPAM
ncbi:MAG: hypothetical protein ABJC04_03410, partial [Verrucomicrobiota bacterium]